ncbi:hypothetical protein HYT74_01145 [Candidatus Daviesbacteria bacterium]|nr:hypothetical protein [Candidatus Daviesbacteria bacterium]MBI2334524.1 hypothetical protein [Candidatus Daviesbacteria bacterium]MBI3109924.1 hypothetical protein [Candidatus Daviesbacteria bacterium]
MWLLLVYLIPVIFAGVVVLRATSGIKRLEILAPAGSILGLAFFVFLINLLSFLSPGKPAILLSYLILLIVTFLIVYLKKGLREIDYPKNKALLFWVLSLFMWLGLIGWKVSHALIGSDVNLYYGIAAGLIKGNFPPLTPWQPDLPLSYHPGSSYLLGSFHFLTNLSFEFLHLFFATLFIFFSAQIIIWILKRHDSLLSFLWGNLASAVALLSFGFLKIAIPRLPFALPQITNLRDLFLWIRDLPTVNQSIEVYGAAANLDGMIYFIFHSFGFAVMLALLTIAVYPLTKNFALTLVVILLGTAALSLINESVFVAAAPAIILLGIFFHFKLFLKRKALIFLVLTLTGLIVFFQGGVITNSSILLFPKKEDIKEDFISYHNNQAKSKKLVFNERWSPFNWWHIGTDALVIFSLGLILFGKFEAKQKILLLTLFASGIFSLAAYFFVVPKFLIANGNRLLVFSHIYLSLAIVYGLFLRATWPVTILLLATVFLPSILPPLALLSINRFGENKLLPGYEQRSEAVEWMRVNLPYDTKVMALDSRAPHPSGLSRVMVQAGVFTPVFTGESRSYTIEASPEYIDIAYFLDPAALAKLKIAVLYVDSIFFQNLPEERKTQLNDDRYFKILFSKEFPDQSFEKVLKVEDSYIQEGGQLDGTIGQLKELALTGRIYIDNEENFMYDYLRRPIIFSLRDKDLYFLPQSGVYLNVEAQINQTDPAQDIAYDYLVLGKNRKPGDVCRCRVSLLWRGLRDEVFVWKVDQTHF